jgi:hypothetical protein
MGAGWGKQPERNKTMAAVLGALGSGQVVIDREDGSHLATHPVPEATLAEALALVDAGGRGFIVEEVKFDRVIGLSSCVSTGTGDVIRYATRVNRSFASRFVVERSEVECRSVVLILALKKEEGVDVLSGEAKYVLITAYVGELAPPEPWDERAFGLATDPLAAASQSKQFWDCHALVWGSQAVIEGTATDICPW